VQSLFPDSFLAAISRLSLDVKTAPPRAAVGTHLSRAAGASLQFRDFQAYTPGDDLRRVDWNVYSRTRHLFVRRFERPTAVPVSILVDASRSMFLEQPSRYATAARVCAAVMSAAITAHNPVYLTIADQSAAPSPRPVSGRRGLVRALAEFSADRVPSRNGIASRIAALGPLLAAKGVGVLVVASDFFDDSGVDSIVDALRRIPGRLVLLRITQPSDANPELTNDVELTDCENDSRLQVSADTQVLARYRAACTAYFSKLESFARTRGSIPAEFDASSDTLGQLDRIFPAGVMRL
jgi:uncharacterized protein (DUF58 family)